MRPRIVPFAESSSWHAVAGRLTAAGRRVAAYANPLRSIAGDAHGLTQLVPGVDGPVVLAGPLLRQSRTSAEDRLYL
ncbi:MAG: hypothetical protein ABWZ63_07065 [Thermoleophilaceae bacterium]